MRQRKKYMPYTTPILFCTTLVMPRLVFRNHVSMHTYEISTRAQASIYVKAYMLKTLTKLSYNIDLIANSKPLSISNSTRMSSKRQNVTRTSNVNIKDPTKVRSKGISNARLKGFWEE